MLSFSFQNVVFYIQVLVQLICVRKFGTVIFDTLKHHDGKVSIKQLHNFEKIHIKLEKAILYLKFLLNCKTLSAVPKFYVSTYHTHTTMTQELSSKSC